MAVTETWKKLSTEAVLKGTAAPFSTVYIGLGDNSFSVIANDAPNGELTGTGYQRLPVQWSDFVSDMSNLNALVWDVGASWGVGAAFVSDSSQGGKVLLWAVESPTILVAVGDTISVNVGNFVLT